MSYFLDTEFILRDDGDPTKEAWFECSGITAGQRRKFTFQDQDGTLALLNNDLSDFSGYGAVEELSTATPATLANFSPIISTPGKYLVVAYLSLRTTTGAGSARLSINWTDNGGAQVALAGVLPVVAAARHTSMVLIANLVSGNLTYTTTFPGVSTGRFDVIAQAVRIS